MNTNDITYILNKPYALNEKQTIALEAVLHEFPYFQAARVLHLKGLLNQDSFRYNYELKKTAANTTDRTILFEFITSNEFTTIQNNLIDEQIENINNISVVQSEIIEERRNLDTEKTEENELEIGKPLAFEDTEKHSFQEWLQLTKIAPIEREESSEIEEFKEEKQKKIEIIDRFIELNPKISPVKESVKTPSNININNDEPTHLMTETLAKVYLEQKKFNKAIQAYEILILKYPEKSSFFADRIKKIKDLQQNN
ncbi:tetratricopeptide repeat protein [Flavobacterium sp.]|uniref:tetratricopeptide repeat protein n=1 Tax=Flavobacterium sp. TaxID=239 RepID=UPI003D294FE2